MAKKTSTLKIKLVRGLAGKSGWEKKIVQSLGLRKVNQIKEHKDNPIIRGMLRKVNHLVEVN